MSKKSSTFDPLTLLKDHIINKKPIKISDQSLSFGTIKLSLHTPTGNLVN